MHVTGQGAIASVVILVQPVVAAALGWVLFAEAIGPVQALGAGVVLPRKAP